MKIDPDKATVNKRRTVRAWPRTRGGFTLLEVLITAILLATLLATIWQLFQMYGALYETGYVQTEKAQLVRSLMQQVSEDLLGTVPPPNPSASSFGRFRSGSSAASQPRTPGESSYAARVGLVGTYNTLRLDVVRTDPPVAGPLPSEESLFIGEQSPYERSGEIATVLYVFVPPAVTAMDSIPDGPGLKRREVRLNQSSEQDIRLMASLSEPRFGSSGAAPRLESDRSGTADFLPENADAASTLPDTTLSLPEVVALEFRYFDGQVWTDAWDSRARRTLPSAVEVSFELDIATAKPAPGKSRTADSASVSTSDGSSRVAEPRPPQPTFDDLTERGPSYRFVIHLPQSALAGKRTVIRGSAEGETEEPSLLDLDAPPEQDQPAAAGGISP